MAISTTRPKPKDKQEMPPHFGLSAAARVVIHRLYVEEGKSVRDSVVRARRETGHRIKEKEAGRFIKFNGWTRSPSYYAQRSVFSGLNNANFEEVKARRKVRL